MARPDKTVSTERVVYEVVNHAMSQQFSGYALESMRVDLAPDMMRDLLNVRAMWRTVAEVPVRVAWPVTEYEPASWFQMFKRQHFPAWAVRRWPIRTRTNERTVIFGLRKLYPDAPAPANFGEPVYHFANPEWGAA